MHLNALWNLNNICDAILCPCPSTSSSSCWHPFFGRRTWRLPGLYNKCVGRVSLNYIECVLIPSHCALFSSWLHHRRRSHEMGRNSQQHLLDVLLCLVSSPSPSAQCSFLCGNYTEVFSAFTACRPFRVTMMLTPSSSGPNDWTGRMSEWMNDWVRGEWTCWWICGAIPHEISPFRDAQLL